MSFWKKTNDDHSASGGGRERSSEDHLAPRAFADGASTTPQINGRAPELNSEQLTKIAAASKALTAAFGEIVALLMRSPEYKHFSLADMEWLIVPALSTGQFSLATAQSRANGLTSPVGLVLWASVSDEVDKRLSASSEQPVKLKPQEWKSGDILWVISAVGNERVIQGMLKGLRDRQWAHKPAKAYARGKDGKPTIVTIEAKAA